MNRNPKLRKIFLWVRTMSMLISLWTTASAQSGLIPAFAFEPNDLRLQRLAQPGTYFDKVGRRFAVLGFESGTFEAWAYPLKLFRGCELSFFVRSSTDPIKARDIVRFVDATPEATTLTYSFQSFTVKAIFITPIDEPGAFILLDVNATEPLTIVCSFLPVLQPMWPAGIGGQSARWLDDIKAYQISEPTRRNTAFIGSPAASGISYTPAHMLSDVPNQFKIEVPDPDAVVGRFIPVIMAGGKGKRDSIKAIYERLMRTPEEQYRRTLAHYRTLRQSTMGVATPHSPLNLAFEWAKVAYDNLIVDNPDLGRGIVAGLGPSGTGGRPGFGWFFSGDAYINSFSIISYGALETVRDILAFTQKWQRADGKMAHELSQAAAYVDWWKDYPYGYIHGDTSPFYLCAMYDYYRQSGDGGFITRSWNSIRRAFDWCLSTDEDGDGLMDNRKAGLGALEYGPLTNIQSDIYTGAVWVRAAYAMQHLARVAGSRAYEQKAEQIFTKASDAFRQKFWDEKNLQYSYAFTAGGEHVEIVSPWSAVGLMWGLGDPERSRQSLEKLNSAELTTDWGIRSISDKSIYYEPLNYNYGAVWPFLTSWVATAQFKHHFPLQGYNSLLSSVRHTFDNSLGQVTEVFSGTHNAWPQEAVPHQGFCTAGVVLPFVRGMLGLESDAVDRTFTFAPQLPADWEKVSISRYRIGDGTVDLTYERRSTLIRLTAVSTARPPLLLTFAPVLGPGTVIRESRIGGLPTSFDGLQTAHVVQPRVKSRLTDSVVIELSFDPAIEVLPPEIETRTGDTNRGLKIISTRFEDNSLTIVTEGLSDERYELRIVNEALVEAVDGAVLRGTRLIVRMPSGPSGEFVRHTIILRKRTT